MQRKVIVSLIVIPLYGKFIPACRNVENFADNKRAIRARARFLTQRDFWHFCENRSTLLSRAFKHERALSI